MSIVQQSCIWLAALAVHITVHFHAPCCMCSDAVRVHARLACISTAVVSATSHTAALGAAMYAHLWRSASAQRALQTRQCRRAHVLA